MCGYATVKTPPVYSRPAESLAKAWMVAVPRSAPFGALTSKVKASRSSSPTRRNAWGRTGGQPSGSSRPTVPVVVARAVGQGDGEPMSSGSEQRPDVGVGIQSHPHPGHDDHRPADFALGLVVD